eukprot:593109-Prorocentrum_minimum.AAC.1
MELTERFTDTMMMMMMMMTGTMRRVSASTHADGVYLLPRELPTDMELTERFTDTMTMMMIMTGTMTACIAFHVNYPPIWNRNVGKPRTRGSRILDK